MGEKMELAIVQKEVKSPISPIDSLPYVDKELSEPGARSRAEQMVKEELKRNPRKREPLEVLDFDFSKAPLSAMEMKRVEAGLPADDMDFSWETPKSPSATNRGNIEAWQIALNNAFCQSQQKVEKMINLEMIQKYGGNAWLLSNKEIERAITRVEKELDSVNAEKEEVNKKRKFDQVSYGKELADLRSRYTALVAKNNRLATTVARMTANPNAEPT